MTEILLIGIASAILLLQCALALRLSILLRKPSTYFKLLVICAIPFSFAALSYEPDSLEKLVLLVVLGLGFAVIVGAIGSILLFVEYTGFRKRQPLTAQTPVTHDRDEN